MKLNHLVLSLLLFFPIFSLPANAVETIEGQEFHTKAEYYKLNKPCACPTDPAKKGKCGKRAAICRDRGYNILDCGPSAVKSIEEYKKLQKELCGHDF